MPARSRFRQVIEDVALLVTDASARPVHAPSTSRTAFLSALEPSSTQSTPWVVSSPRATRSAKGAVATVAFSVEPSQEPERDLERARW